MDASYVGALRQAKVLSMHAYNDLHMKDYVYRDLSSLADLVYFLK